MWLEGMPAGAKGEPVLGEDTEALVFDLAGGGVEVAVVEPGAFAGGERVGGGYDGSGAIVRALHRGQGRAGSGGQGVIFDGNDSGETAHCIHLGIELGETRFPRTGCVDHCDGPYRVAVPDCPTTWHIAQIYVR